MVSGYGASVSASVCVCVVCLNKQQLIIYGQITTSVQVYVVLDEEVQVCFNKKPVYKQPSTRHAVN